MRTVFAVLAVLGVLTATGPAAAQQAPTSVVSIYRAAPGQQVALLKWFAGQDQISQAAGLPASQLYVHQDGASWDFVVIAPASSREQDAALDAAAKKLGMQSGPAVGLEMRKFISEHTDTFAAGPTTAAAWLKQLGQ